GMLDEKFDGEPFTIDNDESWRPEPPFRLRETAVPDSPENEVWEFASRFVTEQGEDGEELRWLVIEKRRDRTESEESRAIARTNQLLSHHQARAGDIAKRLAAAFDLPPAYSKMLIIAARLHDEGKKALRWQRAFNAP